MEVGDFTLRSKIGTEGEGVCKGGETEAIRQSIAGGDNGQWRGG